MDELSVFKRKYHVEFSDVDFSKKLKLSSLFRYFQEVAGSHAEKLGVGFEAIKAKSNVTWVLVRIRVDVERYPLWNEDIYIDTWPQLPKKIESERDFYIKDATGNIIARGVSSWIIIDVDSREIRKNDEIATGYPQVNTERAIDCKLGKLRPFGEVEQAYKKVIGYSDIDINGHLNNTKYIDYIMDCFSMESHKRYRVKSIQVSYVNEALPGDTICLFRDISEIDKNLVYIEGRNEDTEELLFQARVEVELNIEVY